jgi:hypothetical protein
LFPNHLSFPDSALKCGLILGIFFMLIPFVNSESGSVDFFMNSSYALNTSWDNIEGVYTHDEVWLNFFEDGQNVNFGDNALFDLSSGAYSVCMWVKMNSTSLGAGSPYMNIINKERWTGAGDNAGYGWVKNADESYLTWVVFNDGAGEWNTASITANQWTHLCACYTGTNIWLYKDGSTQVSTAGDSPLANDEPLVFGAGSQNGAYGDPFNGSIDDVRFYDQDIGSAGASALYNAGRGVNSTYRNEDLIFYVPMTERIVNVSYDFINNYTGIVNASWSDSNSLRSLLFNVEINVTDFNLTLLDTDFNWAQYFLYWNFTEEEEEEGGSGSGGSASYPTVDYFHDEENPEQNTKSGLIMGLLLFVIIWMIINKNGGSKK